MGEVGEALAAPACAGDGRSPLLGAVLNALDADPPLRGGPISEMERKDIGELHFDMRDKPYQANRTLGAFSKMFSTAEV